MANAIEHLMLLRPDAIETPVRWSAAVRTAMEAAGVSSYEDIDESLLQAASDAVDTQLEPVTVVLPAVGAVRLEPACRRIFIDGTDRTGYVRGYLNKNQSSYTIQDICGAFGGAGYLREVLCGPL